jgi:hypothetical protein
MFTKSSRYNGIRFIETTVSDGRKVNAIFIRRIYQIEGDQVVVTGNDRLDIIASDKYKDPTLFWHIADANTELDANDLVKRTSKVRKILVPEQ